MISRSGVATVVAILAVLAALAFALIGSYGGESEETKKTRQELERLQGKISSLESRLSEVRESRRGEVGELTDRITELEQVARRRRRIDPDDLEDQLDEILRQADLERPYPAVRALRRLADDYAEFTAGVRALALLDRWGLLGAVIDDAHAVEINQRVGPRLRVEREHQEALNRARSAVGTKDERGVREALTKLAEIARARPRTEASEEAGQLLVGYGLREGPTAEGLAKLAGRLVRARLVEEEYRQASAALRSAANEEKVRAALVKLTEIAFTEGAAGERYRRSARYHLQRHGITKKLDADGLAAAASRVLETRNARVRAMREMRGRRPGGGRGRGESAGRALRRARELLAAGKREEGIRALRQIVKQFPGSVAAREAGQMLRAAEGGGGGGGGKKPPGTPGKKPPGPPPTEIF